MTISIQEVTTKKELKRFIKFPFSLYKDCSQYVTPIIDFELSTLLKEKNPAFDHCEAKYWIAKKDGQIVGRIAGIIHSQELKEEKLVRFGWIDFIDDKDVSSALLDEVIEWGKSKGASTIHGPLGFTDLDFEGSLISGFDQMATQATIYNYPYYHEHYDELGFEKAADWVELRGWVPREMPKRLSRTASIINSRFGLSAKKFRNSKEILQYAPDVFKVLNDAYKNLYGYYELTEKQINYYVDLYFGFIRKEFISIVVDENDNVVAIAISLPSLSKAFQKAKGHLYPFGFIPVLRDFKKNDHLDLFLIGVSPEHQKLGASVILFHDLFQTYIEKGVKYVSTGPMLEENQAVLSLWNEFGDNIESFDIKRRCYIKKMR
jgi:GNAT superfamily N-acetyltransferase